ncbi:MAG: TIGR00282 family metallophosphoesterase [Candidatus Omnitrophica bacterium]|nr:TIGR00282 family metallophosphoesterase [Candidatus Omnitrophota bacterium]
MKILFLGDIVGKPARKIIKEQLGSLRKELDAGCVIANGENAAGGSSITLDTAQELFDCGIDVLTSGDHIFKKREAREALSRFDILRPLNYGPDAPGRGFLIKKIQGYRIGVLNLLGRVFLPPMDNPFQAVARVLPEVRKNTDILIVDMHAEATSEKLAMGYYLAGKATAVIGTHTHIPTADERIIKDHTAYITDAGMTGSFNSVLGREKEAIIEHFVSNLPVRFTVAQNDVRIQGVLIDADPRTGSASRICRIEKKRNGTEPV